PTSVHQQERSATLRIIPNPTTGIFTIDVPIDEHATIEIFDTRGMKLFSQAQSYQSKSRVDITSYPPGMYVVVLTVGEQRYFEKVIKQE
ncbi:MAG: T9SS type A sorting domain-containing protein, partial [Candidatus Kapabacteria bacterium]|nr:T9SS type A sorting domain-containing protein [Candidatus Kapabacteria bacterium]